MIHLCNYFSNFDAEGSGSRILPDHHPEEPEHYLRGDLFVANQDRTFCQKWVKMADLFDFFSKITKVAGEESLLMASDLLFNWNGWDCHEYLQEDFMSD